MAPRGVDGLTVRIGSDLTALADDLAAGLAHPAGPVLEQELVVVPTPGIGLWLESVLASRLGASLFGDGICANVAFRLVGNLLLRLDRDADPDLDEWSVEAMTVAALGILLDAAPDDPVTRLRAPDDERTAFAVARTSADLFDQLFRWRPDVAARWLAGDLEDRRAPLLRRLAARASTPPPHEALAAAIARLRGGNDEGVDLPARVHLFGADTLAGGPAMPAVLDALATVREVHVHLVVPSVARFDAIHAATPRFVGGVPDRERGEDGGDPLLRSWGTASGDAARLVAQLPTRAGTSVSPVPGPAPAPPSTLLGALQQTVTSPEPVRRPVDGTVALHGCVGPLRQVEVARDAILHALAEDPSLAPSEVVVLCPDLPRFAPYLEAVLGNPQGAPRLPFVLRDRAVSRAIPLVAALDTALGLLAGRVARSDVLDFLRRPAVRGRFSLSAEDVDRIAEWATETNVRWGLDGAHRAPTGLPATFDAGTWRRALDRLIAGAALPGGLIAGPLGVRAVDVGHSLERVGALGELIDAVAVLRARAAPPRSVEAWCAFAREVAVALLAPSPHEPRARRALDDLVDSIAASAATEDTAIPFAEFRALLADRAARVRELVVTGPGGVTVTSLFPLRHVPFRLVVLLGLDESSLERAHTVDVAFGAARVGDRDPRTELRAALLAAVLAARDRLVVTFEARDVVSNESVAPATVLVELREAIERSCDGPTSPVERVHPRHAHGDADVRHDGGPFTFDRGAHQRAVELREPVDDADLIRPRIAVPRRAVGDRIELDELTRFLRAPQRTFLGNLGVRLAPRSRTPDDELPTSLDDLDRWRAVWSLTDEALAALTPEEDGAAFDEFVTAWAARPDGPLAALPGRLGELTLRGRGGIAERAGALRSQVDVARGEGAWERVDVELPLGDDVLVAELDVFDGSRCVRWTPSSSDHRLLVDSTLDALLLTAWRPSTRWRAYRVFRGSRKSPTVDTFTVPGEDAEERHRRATSALLALLDLRRRGLAEPLPLFFHVTMALHPRLRRGELAPEELLTAASIYGWNPFHGRGDMAEDAVRYCFDASFEELAELPVRPTDPPTQLDPGGSRLLAYSFAMLESLCLLDDVGAPA